MKASKKVFYEIEILPQVVYFGDLLYKRWYLHQVVHGCTY
jgi:hypothetical protein